MANSVCWFCHELRGKGGHVLGHLGLRLKKMKGRPKKTWKGKVGKESVEC